GGEVLALLGASHLVQLRKQRLALRLDRIGVHEAVGVQQADDQLLRLLPLVVLARQRQPAVVQLADERQALLVRRGQRQLEGVLVAQVAQLALGEVLALVDGALQPALVALELPRPRRRLGPEAALLLLARPLRRAGAAPRADQVVERLERLARGALGRRVG